MHGSMGDLFHMFGEVEVDMIANFQTGIALGIQTISLMLDISGEISYWASPVYVIFLVAKLFGLVAISDWVHLPLSFGFMYSRSYMNPGHVMDFNK